MTKKACQLIDGRALAEKIKDRIVNEIATMDKSSSLEKGKPGIVRERPNLAIILVGDREDSRLYVDMKEKEAGKVGIDTHVYKCPANTPETEIFAMIDHLNGDELIDAILVQLPLPAGYDTDGIIRAIDPAKDADMFHPENLERIFSSCDSGNLLPPVCGTVLAMLDSIKFEPQGKTAAIIANSDIFGRTLARVLECRGVKTSVIKPDQDMQNGLSHSDLVVTAVGSPGLVKGGMLKEKAIVIDVGISKIDGKVAGDADFDSAKKVASFISPVPGGVGPMTIAMLFSNTLELYKRRKKTR